IPGVRPGKKTAEYIDRTLTRITLPGAIFLALISVLPDFLIRWFNTPFYFGGTSLLIVVGVALDTVRQMESHLLMRNYEGFPRKVAQAHAPDALFARKSLTLDRVVYFNVSRPELLRRLTGRRVCRTCGHTYHLVSAPPKVAGKCDVCGGELYQRPDDSEATVANRLDVYEKQTAPLLDYYRERHLLAEISGEGPVAEVARAIRKA